MASDRPDGPAQRHQDPGATGDSQRRREREATRLGELIAFQEGRLGVPTLDDAAIGQVLRSSHRIAMVGASSNPARPSHDVFGYLRRAGYDVVPVSPSETEVDGVPAYPDLAAAVEATGPFDIVDVFRRPEFCPDHAREAVAAGARCLWLQLGIVSAEAARIAAAGGLAVVMDRCTKIEVARLGR